MRKIALKATLLLLGSSVMVPLLQGQAKNRREAMGEQLASQMETLFMAVVPGATVEFDPQLAVRVGSDKPIPIDLADFKAMPQNDGTLLGVAAFEVGTEKKDHLMKLASFAAVDSQVFTTTLVAFRADSSGKVTDLKKFNFDPTGPLSTIHVLDVPDWFTNKWPLVVVEYASYIPSADSFTTLAWYSLFDTATGSFRSRIPASLDIKRKDGTDIPEIFKSRRIDPNTIEIYGGYSKRSITYPCSDPCIVDGPTFLSKWPQ